MGSTIKPFLDLDMEPFHFELIHSSLQIGDHVSIQHKKTLYEGKMSICSQSEKEKKFIIASFPIAKCISKCIKARLLRFALLTNHLSGRAVRRLTFPFRAHVPPSRIRCIVLNTSHKEYIRRWGKTLTCFDKIWGKERGKGTSIS